MDQPPKHETSASDWLPTDLVEQAYTLERRAFVRCRLALLRAGDGCLMQGRPALTQSCRVQADAAWHEWETSVDALRHLAHLDATNLDPSEQRTLRDQRRQAAETEERAFRHLMELLVSLRQHPEECHLVDEAASADAEWRAALARLEPSLKHH